MKKTWQQFMHGALTAFFSPPRHAPIHVSTPARLRWKITMGRLQERHERIRYKRSPAYRTKMKEMYDALKVGTVAHFVGFAFVKTDLLTGEK